MNPPPDLSLAIVSYQVRDLLARCLDSLVNCPSPLQLEIFVIDNASEDGTAVFVRDEFASVKLIANAENRGFAAANNQALERASGRHLMLLNPDTVVRPGALEKLVDFMDERPGAGACCPSLFYPDGSRQHSAFGFPSLWQVYIDLFPTNWRVLNSRLNGRYPFALYESGRPFRIDHPLGAAFVVRREAMSQVGLLDESFFIYSEEIDWARRIRGAGWEIWCVPSAEIVHYEAKSTIQFRDKMFVEKWKARLHYFSKHESRGFNAAAGVIVRAGMNRADREARAAAGRGEITQDELERRVEAYERVRTETRACK